MRTTKTLLAILTCYFFTGFTQAQEAVGTSGQTDTTTEVEVTWNLGEIITETAAVGSTDFTQGYVQPIFKILSVTETTNLENISLNLFPNPANQEFTIALDGELGSTINIKISNISGQLLRLETTNSKTHTITIDELTPATYFVEIFTENGKYYNKLKLVKTR